MKAEFATDLALFDSMDRITVARRYARYVPTGRQAHSEGLDGQ